MWRITSKTGIALFMAGSFLSCQKEIPNTAVIKDSVVAVKDSAATYAPKDTRHYQKYSGAWFDIEYPSNFKVENSQRSLTSDEGFDSALFTSPDGKVQFYIFSPQWSGEPTDILLKSSEIRTDSSAKIQNGLQIERWTVKAKDGSYFRSYESISETKSSINKVFGIRYESEKDLDLYRKSYLHFKSSLQQYAD